MKWSVIEGAREFGVVRQTLSNKLKDAGLMPGRGKKFTTKEIHEVLSGKGDKKGNLEDERLSKIRIENELLIAERDKISGRLADVGELEKILIEAVLQCREVILGSALSEIEKEQILSTLENIDL